jgi:hypothetical protein
MGRSSTGPGVYFTRANSRRGTADYTRRNVEIYEYLRALRSAPIPVSGGTFQGKYPPLERDQIRTFIYDNIRRTNLQDQNTGATHLTGLSRPERPNPSTTPTPMPVDRLPTNTVFFSPSMCLCLPRKPNFGSPRTKTTFPTLGRSTSKSASWERLQTARLFKPCACFSRTSLPARSRPPRATVFRPARGRSTQRKTPGFAGPESPGTNLCPQTAAGTHRITEAGARGAQPCVERRGKGAC